MANQKIPVLVCIDVEPDERAIDPQARADWQGFEKCCDLFRQLRARLEAATHAPVHFSWFLRMDPQIAHGYGSADWVKRRYEGLIEELDRASDEVGLHVHAWRWDEQRHAWFADYEDQRWAAHCVQMGFEAFKESFNRRSRSFRFGDHWINNETVALIEKLGARFNLTLEPGTPHRLPAEPFTGSFPDLIRAPLQPYQPSRSDFKKPGGWSKRRLWMIPISTGKKDWAATAPDSKVDLTPLDQGDSTRTYEGYHDIADCETIEGWVYDPSQPDKPLEVEIYDGDDLLARVAAASFRRDLLEEGKGNGKHSFSLPVPSWLKDGNQHTISIKVAGTDFYLSHTPKQIVCQEQVANPDRDLTLDLSYNSLVLRPVIDRLLHTQARPYLALVVRSDVTLHSEKLCNLELSFQHLLSHPLVEQFAFETPAEAIKLLTRTAVNAKSDG